MLRASVLMVFASVCAAWADSGFSVDLAFDEGATTKLETLGEQVIVSVVFYGEPNAEGQTHADEMGQVYLGSEQITVRPLTQTVRIAGNTDQEALARWIKGNAALANVNVFSARFTDENNLLNCGIFDDAVTVAQAATPRIDCTLLTP